MNERIKELALQAGGSHYPDVGGKTLEKFAALIVRECARSANDWYQNHDKIHSDPMSYVLAHFGVERD
ncbi:MAG: hypothetical protein EB127_00650 [Alphaproteobacteria bacterium]|nr:hypothetical protein [Alphaproteobacteria bacterium]